MKNYNIAYFVRPWSVEYFKYISELSDMKNIANAYFISDWSIENTYRIKCNPLTQTQKITNVYSDKEYNKIVQNCRMLRNIKLNKAKALIDNVASQVHNYIIDNKINLIIGIVIDNYIVDIIDRICNERGLRFIGLHMTFIDGYTLITSRGEYLSIRVPETSEIELVRKNLDKKYQPVYINYYKTTILYGIYNVIKNIIKVFYFKFLIYLKKDKYFYHYLSTYLVLKDKIKIYNFYKYFKNYDILNNLKDKLIIYIPLQLTPECNSDYWGDEKDFIKDYEIDIIKLCEYLNENFTILFKEHPNMVGMRREGFYESINKIKNCYILKPNIKAKDIYPKINLTLAYNSSAGIESILYKRKCILLNKVYYYIENIHLYLSKEDIIEGRSRRKIISYLETDIDFNESSTKIIKKILSCCLKAPFNELFFKRKSQRDCLNIQTLTKEIVNHIELS